MSLLNNSDMSVFVGFYLGQKLTPQTERFLNWVTSENNVNVHATATATAATDTDDDDDYDDDYDDAANTFVCNSENELEYLDNPTVNFADGLKAEIVTFMDYDHHRSNYIGAMYNDLVKHDPKLLTEFTYGVLHPDVITEYKTRLTAAVTAQFPELLTLPFEVKVMHH